MGLSWTNSCVSDRPLRPITGGRSNSKMIDDQEILVLGLRLALPKTPEARWRKWSLESQHKKFQNKYGSTHTTVMKIWKELHTTTIDAARLFDKEKNPTYFLMSLLKGCPRQSRWVVDEMNPKYQIKIICLKTKCLVLRPGASS